MATVVLNRPAMRNAINLAMWTDIARLTEKLGKDDSVWAIVYRGAGTEAFASGADISEFPASRKDTGERGTLQHHHRGGLRGRARVSQADDRDDLRLLHGRRGRPGDGVRPALRGRGLEVRHSRRAAEHHLSRRGHRAARRPGGAGVRQGHPVLGARRWRPRGAGHRARSSGCVPAADLQKTTDDYLAAARRQRTALLRGSEAHHPVLPGWLHGREPARLRAAIREATESADYREGTQAFLEKRRPKFHGR